MGKKGKNEVDDFEEPSFDEDDEKRITEEFNKSMDEYNNYQIKRKKEIVREKLQLTAKEKIISKLLEENIRMKLKLNKEMPEENLNDYMKELYLENKGLRDEMIKIEDAKNPIHYFITMRPLDTMVLFDEFKKVVKKLFSKVWMKDYVFVIEQTGMNEDELGKGYHLHAIIKRDDKKPSQFMREVKNTLKDIGDIDNAGFLNIQGIYNNENGLRNRMNYILGEKESDELNNKELKQKMDVIFRQKKYIMDYYFSGEFYSPYILEVLKCPSKNTAKNLP